MHLFDLVLPSSVQQDRNPVFVDELTWHDERLWHCVCEVLEILLDQCSQMVKDNSTLPLSLGDWGCAAQCQQARQHTGQTGRTVDPWFRKTHPEVVADMVQ